MKYRINKKTISIEEFENIDVFGITAVENGEMFLNIEDISPNKKFVESIIHKLLIYNVSKHHIMDIIEDELFDHIG